MFDATDIVRDKHRDLIDRVKREADQAAWDKRAVKRVVRSEGLEPEWLDDDRDVLTATLEFDDCPAPSTNVSLWLDWMDNTVTVHVSHYAGVV